MATLIYGSMLIAAMILMFSLLREFWLWYFGISEVTRLLRSIDESLRQLPAVQRYDHTIGRS